MSQLPYEERLRKIKLPSFEYRQLRGDMIQVFKIAHNYYDKATVNNIFEFNKDSRLRGHNYKIIKKFTNKTKYQKFFTNRVVNKWNNLPPDIVNSKSINEFKNKFDTLNKDIQFSININYFD